MPELPLPLRPRTFSLSDETRIHPSYINNPSTFNNVGGHQFNITNIQQSACAFATSCPPSPSHVDPFNDAPIDLLSGHFTGRKKELALITEAFKKRRDQNIPPRCVLFGNQGVGKSQLTYAWAKTTYLQEENSYILWISATTVEKLHQGFSRLLRFIDHPDRSHPEEGVRLDAARRWLEGVKTGNWLLVLDNVFPETLEFLRQNLPRHSRHGTMLFTTRTERVALALASTAGERHDVIEVPLLDIKAGVELFVGHFESGTIDLLSGKVETLVMAVGCLPLAISHAAWYMKESLSSLDDLLKLYQSRHKIDVISWEHTLSDYEHKSVAATFVSQLQDLTRHCPDASKLFRVLAFLDPESIPLEMLTAGTRAIVDAQRPLTRSRLIASVLSMIQTQIARQSASVTASLLSLIQSPVALQNAITQLQTRCLVIFHASSKSPTFRIHDLIQLVVSEDSKRSELNQELFEFAVALVCATFMQIENVQSHESWPRCELLLPHIQSLTLHQDTSSIAKKMLLLANHRRGMYLSYRGRYVEAESLYEDIIAEREKLFGCIDLEALSVMNDLAWVYQCRGRYVDAEALSERVLKSRKAQLGPEHRDTLRTMYNFGRIFYRQKRLDDADILLQQTVQSQESQFGLEDKDTLWTMTLLANVYNEQRRYDEADSLLTRVLQTREKLLGSEHIDTLHTTHVLARVYISQQNYDDAAALLQQILRTWETDLGSQHPDTVTAMYHLACVYNSQCWYKDAENLLERVLAARKRILGLSHPHTQSAINLLAGIYEQLGRLDEAAHLRRCPDVTVIKLSAQDVHTNSIRHSACDH